MGGFNLPRVLWKECQGWYHSEWIPSTGWMLKLQCLDNEHIQQLSPFYKLSFLFVFIFNLLWQWALMTLLDPVKSLAHFIYLNYPGDVSTAFQISRRRRIDRKRQCTQRNVTNCFVFGPDKAGKTTLIRTLIGRYYLILYVPFEGPVFTSIWIKFFWLIFYFQTFLII